MNSELCLSLLLHTPLQVISAGMSKLQSIPSGGAAAAAGASQTVTTADGAAAPKEEAKEEEPEEEDDMGFSLFD